MVLTFALGMAASSWYAYQLTQDNALRQVTDQAELLLEHSVALRSYTVNEIRPLTENGDGKYEEFHPQTALRMLLLKCQIFFGKNALSTDIKRPYLTQRTFATMLLLGKKKSSTNSLITLNWIKS